MFLTSAAPPTDGTFGVPATAFARHVLHVLPIQLHLDASALSPPPSPYAPQAPTARLRPATGPPHTAGRMFVCPHKLPTARHRAIIMPQLEAGAIRSKNAMNILLQTLIDASAAAIVWYLIG